MNGCKYYKQEEQVSYDNKQTWENTGNYRKGELYESYSSDCPEYQRWKLVPGGFICEDGSKYQKLISEISDDGVNYIIKYPAEYSAGTLIETDAYECNYKWYGHYITGTLSPIGGVVDPIKIVLCSGSSEVLTSTDTTYDTGYVVQSGYVGSCVSSMSNNLFSGQTELRDINMVNSSISSIPDSAFTNCIKLTACTIPSGVTRIGQYAFLNAGLHNINISDATSIGYMAFSACTSLTSCTFGSGITVIGDAAFFGCSGLTSITVNAVTPPTLGGENVFVRTNDCPIYVPAASVSAYIHDTRWARYASRIQAIPT